MQIKCSELNKVLDISVQFWKNKQWGCDVPNDLLTDTVYFDGIDVGATTYSDYKAWIFQEREKLYNGESGGDWLGNQTLEEMGEEDILIYLKESTLE